MNKIQRLLGMFILSLLHLSDLDSLKFLLKSGHLILLSGDQCCFGGNNFLVSGLHVLVHLVILQLLTLHLHLVGFGVPAQNLSDILNYSLHLANCI